MTHLNSNEKNFLDILSCAVNGREYILPGNIDFAGVLEVAARQQLFGIVADKLSENNKFRESAVFMQVKSQLIKVVVTQARHSDVFISLYKTFNSFSLYPLVMKGIICRKLYGKYADYRPSSDEDILIKPEEFEKVKDVLITQGYVQTKDYNEEQFKDVQAVSFYNKNLSMNIEVHINPIGHGNEMQKIMDSYFHDVFDDYIEIEIAGVKLRTMSHTKHFLFLMFHAIRHFAGSGMGIRQLLDILFYMREYCNAIEWDLVLSALKKVNGESFFADIISIGNDYLGFSLPVYGGIKIPDELLDDLFFNGIFGNDTNAKIMAGTLTYMAAGKKSDANGSTLLKTIFPDKNYMLRDNPELSEKPWLLPFAWFQRFIRFIRRNNKNNGGLAKESLIIGNRRIELLEKYGII